MWRRLCLQPCRHSAHTTRLWHPGGRRPTEPEEWGQVSQASGAKGSCEYTSSSGSTPTLTQGRTNTDWSGRPLLTAMSLSWAHDQRAPAGRPSGGWGETLQSSMLSSGQPQLSLGAAIHPAPRRLQCEPFTQLVPPRQSAGWWPAPGGCLWMG